MWLESGLKYTTYTEFLPMAKIVRRNLSVRRTQTITPNMQRITLGGEDLADFPADKEGDYIKLIFPDFSWDSLEGHVEKLESMNNGKPCLRTYTIRKQDTAAQELEIDFVLHGATGPASAWAMNAKVGDEIGISGPGAKKEINKNADWFFIAGDMTALPSISVILESLPRDAKGYAVIDIVDELDRQNIDAPENIEIHWVVQSADQAPETLLSDKVRTLPFLAGQVSVWVACEFSAMRELRQYFRNEHDVERDYIYVSSYWKVGISEDKHKVVKRQDAEQAQ